MIALHGTLLNPEIPFLWPITDIDTLEINFRRIYETLKRALIALLARKFAVGERGSGTGESFRGEFTDR